MHEQLICVEGLVKPDGEGGEDRVGVGASIARQGLVHMFEAALNRSPVARQKRELRGAMSEAFQRRESVDRRDFANCVHLRMNIERREARGPRGQVGNSLAQLLPNVT